MLKLKQIFLYSGLFFLAISLKVSYVQAFAYEEKVSNSKALAHYAMGQIYDNLGLFNRAILEYESAAQYDESSYLIYLRAGVDYARLNMLSEAIASLKLVDQYNPEELQSHYLLALIYSTQREYDKAAEEYEYILKKFSKAEPQNIEIYSYLGQLYYSQKKYDQAITQFEKILEIEPDNPDVMYLLGSLYLEVDKNDRSIDLLKQSIEIDPNHDGSLNTLGYIYAERGMNLDEAEDLIQRALEISPNNGAYLDSLGWVHYKQGRYEDALKVFKNADEYLKDPVIYHHMGDVYLKLNSIENAVKYWKLSLELQPDQEDLERKINEVKNSQASR
ncbi:MAG: tetratricopeptide repeat protein [Candidatus Omnitrophica bacterium]|nr:tetratricopeptide repeat protein [Candidatus Omnitrophota bacterium]